MKKMFYWNYSSFIAFNIRFASIPELVTNWAISGQIVSQNLDSLAGASLEFVLVFHI